MLLGLAADGSRAPDAPCRPPRGFRSAEGVRRAWPTGEGPYGRTPSTFVPKNASAAQKAGLRYEKRVRSLLEARIPGLRPGQWFRYEHPSGGVFYCQPDAVLVHEDRAVVFEIKYTFTSDAWWQLRRLYEPVVRAAYYAREVGLCIVCRNRDPHTPFPEPVTDIELSRLIEWPTWASRGIVCLSWRP